MGKCVLCEKEIGDLEESSLHQCEQLRFKRQPSPPTDVVEAARLLMSFDYNYMEPPVDLVQTVCKWVLAQGGTQ